MGEHLLLCYHASEPDNCHHFPMISRGEDATDDTCNLGVPSPAKPQNARDAHTEEALHLPLLFSWRVSPSPPFYRIMLHSMFTVSVYSKAYDA